MSNFSGPCDTSDKTTGTNQTHYDTSDNFFFYPLILWFP